MRFPGFTDEWKEYTIKDIAKIEKGIGISKNQLSYTGEECILYGELYTKYKSEIIEEVLSKTDIDSSKLMRSQFNDVLIPCSGETAEDIATARYVKKDGILLGGDLNIIRFDNQDGAFMSYQLNGKRKYDIARVAQGVSVVHLYPEHLKSIKVCVPQLEEQQKVVRLLSLIDKRIATQNKIINDLKKLKSAISKLLLWHSPLLEKKISISEIGSLKNGYAFQSSSYNPKGEYEILTIANVTGDRYICSLGCNRILTKPSDLQTHQELKKNDILISMTGNVGRVSLCKDGKYLLNQRVGLLKVNSEIDADFVYQALSSQNFEQNMISCSQGAAQMNIGKGDVENYKIPYSDNSDNLRKISMILNSYDKKIEIEARVQQVLNEQKSYLLTSMFI